MNWKDKMLSNGKSKSVLENITPMIATRRKGICRVCGKITDMTATSRYLLCNMCKIKGIKID